MDAQYTPLELLQARTRLKSKLPLLPEEEQGILHLSYPALEGFLFALQLSPFELDIGIWGPYLEQFMPSDLLNSPTFIDDVIIIYSEILDAVNQNQLFKTHTLTIPPTLCGQDPVTHPLYHWTTGCLTGFHLVEMEMKSVRNPLKKSKAYRKLRTDFQKFGVNMLMLLHIKLTENNEEPLPLNGAEPLNDVETLLENMDLLLDRLMQLPLNEFFTFTLKILSFKGDMTKEELDRII